MEAAIQRMESASTIGNKLGMIQERAINITSVIAMITKIADQTNLLSLNTAKEAENVGEHGWGLPW
jgi:methyl-accepting chemotaxis protein WspA